MGHTMPQADRATQLADAAFIVTAVNAYDDYVSRIEALERENAELRAAINRAIEEVVADDMDDWFANLRAAIMDAKEREE